jgi:hypothetical protein
MKNKFSKAMLLFGIAFSLSTAGIAQDTKFKVEREDYELKVKQEGDELKIKEKGARPLQQPSQQSTMVRQGTTVTTVKQGEMPKEQTVAKQPTTTAKKKTYAARKKTCTCKTVAKKAPVKKRTVAYRPKAKTTTVASVKPATVIVRDTVFVTRVDTVFTVSEMSSFTGNRSNFLRDNFKKLKVEREDGEITIKKEYEDGEEIKKTFDNEEEFNTYMEWKNY